jgi:hypothetical protein
LRTIPRCAQQVSNQGLYFGDFLQQARHYDLPGTDTIWRQIFPGQSGGNYVGLASSSSWLRGQQVALTECGAVYGAGLTLEQIRWIAGFHLVRGVNKLAFMAAPQSDTGTRRVGLCGIDFSLHSPLWQHADLLFDYVRRVAQFTVSGEARPRIGVFYRSELVDDDESQQFDAQHEALCERLHDAMSGVLFVGLDDLKTAFVQDGSIHIRHLILSLLAVHISAPLDCGEKRELHRLAGEGARILWYGEDTGWNRLREEMFDEFTAQQVYCSDDLDSEILQQLLHEISPFEVQDDLRGIRVLPLQEGARQKFLLFNQNSCAVAFEFRLKCGDRLAEVPLEDAATIESSLSPLNHDRYCIEMQPGELRALEAVPTTTLQDWSPPDVVLPDTSRAAVLGDWRVREEESFLLRETIERVASREAAQPTRLGDYSVRHPYFSGTLLFETEFDIEPEFGERVLLDLGQVFYCASVRLNGCDCGRRAWPPFIFDITDSVLRGRNALQIRVTNTMANQWTRPDIRQQDFELSANVYLEKSAPYIDESCHAGLIGPVVVRTYAADVATPLEHATSLEHAASLSVG